MAAIKYPMKAAEGIVEATSPIDTITINSDASRVESGAIRRRQPLTMMTIKKNGIIKPAEICSKSMAVDLRTQILYGIQRLIKTARSRPIRIERNVTRLPWSVGGDDSDLEADWSDRSRDNRGALPVGRLSRHTALKEAKNAFPVYSSML